MLEYCWSNLRNKLQWNLKQYVCIFIQENVFKNVATKWRQFRLGLNVLKSNHVCQHCNTLFCSLVLSWIAAYACKIIFRYLSVEIVFKMIIWNILIYWTFVVCVCVWLPLCTTIYSFHILFSLCYAIKSITSVITRSDSIRGKAALFVAPKIYRTILNNFVISTESIRNHWYTKMPRQKVRNFIALWY